jgi:hypothetical protein
VFQYQVTSTAPFLDSKPLNVNVTGTFSGFAIINDIDSRLVIFIDNCRASNRGESKLAKDRTNIPAYFACMDSCKEANLALVELVATIG